MRILVAEDDAVSRMVLERTLKSLGHDVDAVADGAAAWEAYRKRSYPVVIADWSMPHMDGLELVCRVRAMRSKTYTWCILLTARDFEENYAATMKAGVDDYLTKPLNRDLLLVRLEVARRVLEMNGQIELLQACIPICMCCKAVRDTTDNWRRIEHYLTEKAGLGFSHSFCPDCFYEQSVRPEVERFAQERGETPGLAAFLDFDRDHSPGLARDVASYLALCTERLARVADDGATRRWVGAERDLAKRYLALCTLLGAKELARAVESLVVRELTAGDGPTLRSLGGEVVRSMGAEPQGQPDTATA